MTERGFDVAHLDELDALPVVGDGLVWRPVRRRFGIESFGVNARESSFAAFALHRKGDNEGALAAMQEGLERYPDAWEAHYNASCLHSLLEDFDRALEHLRRAVELNGAEVRKLAGEDTDFDSLRDDRRFGEALSQ